MRGLFFFWVILGALFLHPPAFADDAAPSTDGVVQEFSGGGPTTTSLFAVKDRWEVRWNARQVVSVAVMSSDGTIVAGAAGVLRGSLFVPLGGHYYLKVSDGGVPLPAPAPVPASTHAPPVSPHAAPVATSTNAVPVMPVPIPDTDTSPPSPDVTWHLQIVQLNTSVSADQALTVYTPFFIVPDSAVTPVATPVVAPPPALTDEQSRAVVTIKGDAAQGTGFLMRSPEGTFAVTHTDLLAANPNVKVLTSSGTVITTLGLKCATDRDIALFAVEDNHYAYLPSPTDAPDSLPAGDQLIIPDVGAPSDVLAGKVGRVINTNAERIDFGNRMGPGNSGAPIIHVKSGTVVGLVTAEKKVDVSEYLAQAWRGNPAPGSSAIIPYYGLRLGGVRGWETCDPARFLQETMFLKQFHQDTRRLDSYLNGRRRRFGDNDEGMPDNQLYLESSQMTKAQNSYRQLAGGADVNQRLEAARELLYDLQGFADTNLATLRGMRNLYSSNQNWAREEIAYRVALKKELAQMGGNIVWFDNIARSR